MIRTGFRETSKVLCSVSVQFLKDKRTETKTQGQSKPHFTGGDFLK